MKLQNKGGWILFRSPEVRVERTEKPSVLTLEQAVQWIKVNKPFIWQGSIFSVPSGMPSGFALTQSVLRSLLPPPLPDALRETVVNDLFTKWPLEALLDEFTFVGHDIADDLLSFFRDLNDTAAPNVLHDAITKYYETGLSSVPLCITTNWDTLQERSFSTAGFEVVIAGPGKHPNSSFGKSTTKSKQIFLYHPHGSFSTKDVVCSFRQEQRQLTLHTEFESHPTLFLGYSGYEPSLYRKLEHSAGQLWCIKTEDDFNIPAKRRLLCRPNTHVFVGDMCGLLRALGVLQEDVELTSNRVQPPPIAEKVSDVLRAGLLASLAPKICVSALREVLVSSDASTEATIKYVLLTRALVNHVRDRIQHEEIFTTLEAATRSHNSEQLWITMLAYLLRCKNKVEQAAQEKLLSNAEEASRNSGDRGKFYDEAVYMPGVLLGRTRCYQDYVRRPKKTPKEKLDLAYYPALFGGDMAAYGEHMELLAFDCLRENNSDAARNYFDDAATAFYLRGLWNAGHINEWASKNIDKLAVGTIDNSLFIPWRA